MIKTAFDRCRENDEAALICYFPAGYPDLETSLEIMISMAEAGADILEVGVPFSDPVADGPVIQSAAQKALENGVSLRKILAGLSRRTFSVPLLLMSYLNPLLAYGERLMEDVCKAGVSGFIVPDLPVDESAEFSALARKVQLDLVLLAAPTSSEHRLKAVAEKARGFVYTVSRAGITGQGQARADAVRPLVARLKSFTSTPVAVGFGVDSAQSCAVISDFADGVIVGSRLVKAFNENEDLTDLIISMKQAARRGKSP